LRVKKEDWQLLRWFDRVEEYILVALFPLMVITVFVATCVRYLTTSSIPWAEEFARYCMVWIGYIGASLGIKRNAHIGVAVLVSRLPARIRPVFDYLRTGFVISFNLLVAYFAYQIIQSQIATEQVSPALRIPIWIAYGAIPAGMLLMTVRCLQAIRNGPNPSGEPTREASRTKEG
jgi:C4-dicarboxylate transporter DctQ subunit